MAPHVLLFPFPGQGHINPLLDLAHRLAESGVLSTLLLTPAHYATYQQPQFANNLQLAALDLSSNTIHKLLAAAGCGTWILTAQILASDFPAPLRSFIDHANATSPPISCLISDSLMPWTAGLAAEFRIPRIEMWTTSAATYLYSTYVPLLLSKGHLPFKPGTEDLMLDFLPDTPNMRMGNMPLDMLSRADLTHPTFHAQIQALIHADRVLVNSFHKLEAGAIAALRKKNVKMIAVGPTLGVSVHDKDSSHMDEARQKCLQWLDKQEAMSVVYVAFGSAGLLTEEEIRELANTLEAVGRPFLWAIRDGSATESLPANFRPGRLSAEKGLVVPWAPQRQVLEHGSVGAFVSHCGWNSVLESLWNGVPIVGCPRVAEQNTNMWLVQEWGIGVAGVGTELGGIGSIRSHTLTTVLKSVMGTTSVNEKLRKKVSEMAVAARVAVSPSGTSTRAFHEFVDWLHTKC